MIPSVPRKRALLVAPRGEAVAAPRRRLSDVPSRHNLEAVRQFRSESDDPAPPACIDDVDWKSLYRKSKYEVRTRDGWTLVVTRYQPTPQAFPQPIRGEPLLLVHGFSQNRHAWTCGGFVKHMLWYGADVHILELRGHGLSSVDLQRRKAAAGAPLPADINYGWDIDSYYLEDIPAAIEAVKQRTGRSSIFYCGHSLGGMLGYGYATLGRDLAGLVTIGAPADPRKGYLGVRLLARFGPAFELALDAALLARWTRRWATWQVRDRVRRIVRRVRPRRRDRRPSSGAAAPERERFEYYPFDVVLRMLDRALDDPRTFERWERIARARLVPSLANPTQITLDAVRLLLREGGEREPRKVVAQLWRWIREGRLCCYRTGYDFQAAFSKIRIPMAIIFGDLDPLAGIDSTRDVYRAARSEYLLWRPVKGNSHVDLTMGRDVRQICFDVKNLIAFARTFPARAWTGRSPDAEPSPDAEVIPVRAS